MHELHDTGVLLWNALIAYFGIIILLATGGDKKKAVSIEQGFHIWGV